MPLSHHQWLQCIATVFLLYLKYVINAQTDIFYTVDQK